MTDAYRFNLGLALARVAGELGERPALRLPDGEVVTYAELDVLGNRCANAFLAWGVRRRDVIAIFHRKTAVCFGAMLGALKIGAAYVNIDDHNPPIRLQRILDSARPSLIAADGAPDVLARLEETGIPVFDFSTGEGRRALARAEDSAPSGIGDVVGSDPAYIMFTSGSTGIPKGAVITHAAVLNFGAWAAARFGISPADVLSNVNPLYFDNSVFDVYAALLNGASLVPISREVMSEPKVMLEQLEIAGCTIWFSVPSLLIYLSTLKLLSNVRLESVRTFVFGGEGYPKPELRKLFDVFGKRSRLVNVYGPTECTCICSAWDVGEADLADSRGLVTLGRIAENVSMLVLGDSDEPVAAGEVGELCLMGPQVGLGYLNDPERTAAAFVRNPTNDGWDERMYRTGDLVRLGEDGRMLDFVGRKDNQIKHMGYRIELEEIEAALNGLVGVLQSAVLHAEGRRGHSMIVAFLAVDREWSEERLRSALVEVLPSYMIPQRFHVRAGLPKNANGKIDRQALAREAGEEGG